VEFGEEGEEGGGKGEEKEGKKVWGPITD